MNFVLEKFLPPEIKSVVQTKLGGNILNTWVSQIYIGSVGGFSSQCGAGLTGKEEN